MKNTPPNAINIIDIETNTIASTAKLNSSVPVNAPLIPSTPYVRGFIMVIHSMAGGKFFAGNKALDKKKVGMIRLKTIWPFADRLIRNLGAEIKKIFVPEMNMGQMAGEIMKYAPCDVISFSQTNGEVIYPHTIMEQLGRLL